MTAIRSVRAAEGKFVQISNAAMQDRRLSGLARGILAFVLSLPPDRRLTAEWLETQLPEGRRAIRRALGELAACGYYRRTRTSAGGTWVWEQVLSDAPMVDKPGGEGEQEDEAAFPQMDACDRFAQVHNAPDAKRPAKELNTEPSNTKDGSSSMASRRARADARAIEDEQTKIGIVASAVTASYGDSIEDHEALRLWDTYIAANGKPIRDAGAFLSKIFADTPDLGTLLANADEPDEPVDPGEWACGGCGMVWTINTTGHVRTVREWIIRGSCERCCAWCAYPAKPDGHDGPCRREAVA